MKATALTEQYGLPATDVLNVVTSTVFAAPSYQRYGGTSPKTLMNRASS